MPIWLVVFIVEMSLFAGFIVGHEASERSHRQILIQNMLHEKTEWENEMRNAAQQGVAPDQTPLH